ncbi:glutaredoxin-like protein [Plasmodium chabaudi adami]|uniref:Glutaredoxin-like protein n=1 Tax=Plasmodium chabaudi adami TaxID=5826 RepID=A0A1D3S0M2_PLACE|nr:glutaredoxin-like protein [Plasmodium chabaudi adami]
MSKYKIASYMICCHGVFKFYLTYKRYILEQNLDKTNKFLSIKNNMLTFCERISNNTKEYNTVIVNSSTLNENNPTEYQTSFKENGKYNRQEETAFSSKEIVPTEKGDNTNYTIEENLDNNLCDMHNNEVDCKSMKPNELNTELSQDDIDLIENILKKHKLVLFMKGTALNPFCKYSRLAINILKLNKAKEIYTVNILNDDMLKHSLKIYSKWPTFPQLYINGKFVGGIDKIQELHDNKQLQQMLQAM